jgi:hypothetical protein
MVQDNLYHIMAATGSLEEIIAPQRDLVITFQSESYPV